MRNLHVGWVAIAVGCAVLGGLGGYVMKARADGIPSSNPLVYSGTLTESGQLANGMRTIGIYLYADGTSTMPLCQTVASTNVVSGRFRIALDDTCKAKINANPNAFVEILDGAVNLGRSKIGAVPYAIEADHAVGATNAVNAVTAATANAAGGALATTIAELQARVHADSAFHAYQKAAKSILYGALQVVAFDTVEYDLGGEYTVATGIFRPKSPGVYLVNCGFEYVVDTAGTWTAAILRNGLQVNGVDLPGSAQTGVSPTVTAMVQLATGDALTCATAQNNNSATSDQALYVGAGGPARNTFSAARLY